MVDLQRLAGAMLLAQRDAAAAKGTALGEEIAATHAALAQKTDPETARLLTSMTLAAKADTLALPPELLIRRFPSDASTPRHRRPPPLRRKGPFLHGVFLPEGGHC